VFLGGFRGPPATLHHAHEAPALMRIPLVLLAAGSIVAGFAGVPHFLGGSNRIESWITPATAAGYYDHSVEAAVHGHAASAEWAATLVAIAVAVAGGLLGFVLYARRPQLATGIAARLPWLKRLLEGKYYVDELYDAVVVRPLGALSDRVLWRGIDVRIIDGLVNLVAGLTKAASWLFFRMFQSGYVQTYVLFVVLGVTALLWLGM
jgi:NADH-quinone oxidoreductase subunit L